MNIIKQFFLFLQTRIVSLLYIAGCTAIGGILWDRRMAVIMFISATVGTVAGAWFPTFMAKFHRRDDK